MLVLDKPCSQKRVNAALSTRSRMELETRLALSWDKGERSSGFFISDIFTCFRYHLVPVMQQLRYHIVPRTELLSLFSSHEGWRSFRYFQACGVWSPLGGTIPNCGTS